MTAIANVKKRLGNSGDSDVAPRRPGQPQLDLDMSQRTVDECLICKRKAEIQRDSRGLIAVHCALCGYYLVTEEAELGLVNFEELKRLKLNWYTREQQSKNQIALLTWGRHVDVSGIAKNIHPATISEVSEDHLPNRLEDRIDRALLNLSRMSQHLGHSLDLKYEVDGPVLFAQNADEMEFVMRILQALGFINEPAVTNIGFYFTIRAAGWQRANELRSGHMPSRPRQAFVAMWFGSSKSEFEGRISEQYCTDLWAIGLKGGIETAGYEPLRIDIKHFTGDINDEMLAEIRRSKFIVADFTGNRHGVYFEAGFALGLGIPVFFTCHHEHLGELHFDTNHFNHIAWKSFDDLAKRLSDRIVAVLGEPGAQ